MTAYLAVELSQILELLRLLPAFLLLLCGAGLGLWRWLRTRQGAQTAELERLAQAQAALEELLHVSLYGLITQAENSLGAGAGAAKKGLVLAELLRLLPEHYKTAFPAETLGAWIETALEEMRPTLQALKHGGDTQENAATGAAA
ncbi:MAG: hypothetical protein LBC83_07735 [Oscillospiraceae bacterium]|jgi:hypothetical protein|nr:hypothetical protein [Oscillospiraceae bacterium]